MCKKRVSDSSTKGSLPFKTFPLRKLLVSEMYVLVRVTVSEIRFISETNERFVLYESNACTAGFYVAGGSCQQVVTVTLTHILVADVPSLNSGRGGKGTTSDQKLRNCLHRLYLCILSAITDIKVQNK
jgi:hypothetical protein